MGGGFYFDVQESSVEDDNHIHMNSAWEIMHFLISDGATTSPHHSSHHLAHLWPTLSSVLFSGVYWKQIEYILFSIRSILQRRICNVLEILLYFHSLSAKILWRIKEDNNKHRWPHLWSHLSSQQTYKIGPIIMHILQMRKLRHSR